MSSTTLTTAIAELVGVFGCWGDVVVLGRFVLERNILFKDGYGERAVILNINIHFFPLLFFFSS